VCARLVALLVLLGLSARARAAEPVELRKGPRATGAAIFPGIIVNGSGHFVAGDRRTGLRLLAMQGTGIAVTVGGFAALAVTGASRQLGAPVFALPVAGVGLVAVSWLSDIYGVSAPAGGTGAPALVTPTVEARLGTRYVYDPTLSYGTLLGPAADLRWRRLRLSPGAWLATDGDNVRLSLEAAFRFFGPRPFKEGADGSYFDLVLGGSHHRYRESFELTVFDVSVRGRTDLRRLASTLTGSFAEWGVGLGWALTHYRVGARETDAAGLLLARFGYGLYLGHRPGRTAEVMVYYDHRHDDYAGGTKLGGLGSGVAGHFGLEGTWYFLERWGARLEAQTGSAHLAGVYLIHRSRLLGGGW
jgi:hypothetical protein